MADNDNVVEVPKIKVAVYHPKVGDTPCPIQVLIYGDDDKVKDKVLFEDTPSGHELANEYYTFKSGD